MYIGLGVVLLVVGLVFRLDVTTFNIKYVNEHALGDVLIAGGILAIVLSLILSERFRRRSVVDEGRVVERHPVD